jgi:transposase-like protein
MLETHEECLAYLEQLRWHGIPTCPYCGSIKASVYKNERRYRCNTCFTSYSVTVGTIFHKTHVDLRIWFQAILLLVKLNPEISARKLAKDLGVSRATASLMIQRIRNISAEQAEWLTEIVQITEQAD